MKNSDIIIDISNLSYSYNSKRIYENLNLQIKEGTIFGLLGKNGVGKSTLINILMGFLKPNSGKCLIFGEPSHNLSAQIKKDIALLYEGFITYDFMSIKEIEKYFAPFYPNWKKPIFYELINLMNLNHNQKLSTLSFGQKSQVILGLLFAQDAKLLILDDYSMGLDAGYRRLFIDYLKDYVKETNKTVLITSHIMSDLVDLIDDIAIIQKDKEIYKNSMKSFIENFRCYKLNKNEQIDLKNVHRVESHKNYKKIYTFENFDSLEELKVDFEDKFLGYVGKY
ncbi:ABC transporter ATP-binding protein [Aliarcobacter butzleri]|uniref:ABC transporter ATP-binding protein n=1 Tax=Aliarcobacter butzleri TaxID=28197 RepID=UPI001EDDD827|nr:ABC transporter ATP-binding protein [Aliarcobacter butzleri]MCG3670597.1 ABC transporter ATP-binding protein [Aliarcobacter butzleri]